MKSELKSCGNFFLGSLLLVFVLNSACTLVGKRDMAGDQSAQNEVQSEKGVDATSSGETALSADRKEIEELRQNIPAEKRIQNDELKEILALTGEVKDPPSRIREKYNRMAQREREQHRRESTRAREEFNRTEKDKREKFFKELNEERDSFKKKKADRDASRRFYDEQDRLRREFTSDERDLRSRFNADQKQKDDDFNQMTRDRQQDFNQQMRDYEQRYREWQKELKEAKETKKNTLNMGVKIDSGSAQPNGMAPAPLKTGSDKNGK